MDAQPKERIIYDPLYGFIYLNEVEWEIIHSPFYQRLRWIKQLGFSFYVFLGAEHSRFGHSIGAMYNAHCILKSIKKSVPDKHLFDSQCLTNKCLYHKSIRLAALMHDLGAFPFSHTTEAAYIRFGQTARINNRGTKKGTRNPCSQERPQNEKGGQRAERELKDDHENLASFIIKNTDYPGGITFILQKYGIDPQQISDLVKGVDKDLLANQILHSEVDCDRMDYLLRDAHYTGLQYGSYDRTYLLHHFRVECIGKKEILTIHRNAIHCVEDFLLSRFAWYSQVIRSTRGAKFDAIAERLCFYLLEKGKILKYSHLLELVASDPARFFGFNDHYFMNTLHELYVSREFDKDAKIKDMVECLIFERPCRAVQDPALKRQLLNQDTPHENEKIIKKAKEKHQEIQKFLECKGGKADWLVDDIPEKNNIILVKSKSRIIKEIQGQNVLLTRDPVKISYPQGKVELLADTQNSVISLLQNTYNFIPNIYCSESCHQLLVKSKLVE